MKIILGLFLLDFLVFFHEFGHFFVAKIFKISVEAFSIGMGPILLRKKIKNTEFRISLIPLGGYCALKGENYENEDFFSKNDFPKDSIFGCDAWKAFLVSLAGPFANFLFAFFALFFVALIGFSYEVAGTKILLEPDFSLAAQNAGILSGDKILSINEKVVSNFSEIQEAIFDFQNEELKIKVLRENEILDFLVLPENGKIGISSDPEFLVEQKYKAKSLFDAGKMGAKKTCSYFFLTFKGIKQLFSKKNFSKTFETLGGPAQLSSILGNTAKFGFSSGAKKGFALVFEILAIVSISLCVINLLPIPILDGAAAIFSLFEWIFGTRIPKKVRFCFQIFGLLILIFIFSLAIINDFKYFRGF